MPSSLRPSLPILAVSVAFLMTTWIGCGSEESGISTQGTVMLDGKPLPNGLIHFEPMNGSGANASRRIEAGEFRFPPNARLAPGKYKVSIRAIPPDSEADADATMNRTAQPKFIDPVPSKYNVKTELVADVTEEGPNTFQYDLTSP